MIEVPDFLPLGSVISLKGSAKTLMVVSRGVVHKTEDGGKEYFDYGMCLYPEGVIGDAIVFSNHDCIDEVHFKGYSSEADEEFMASVREVLPEVDIPKGQPKPISEW